MRRTDLRSEGKALKISSADVDNYPISFKNSTNEKCQQNNKFIYERIQFTDSELDKLIDILTGKGTKILTLFSHNRTILEVFKEKHMKNNAYIVYYIL